MRQVVARALTPEGFARFGRVHDLGQPGEGVSHHQDEDWTDGFTRMPLIDGPAHLGMTRADAAPWTCRQMERHPRTQEALFCAGTPIVLAVAPAGAGAAPATDMIEAFVIRPGQLAVMDRGVWHDACRGLDAPTAYYWSAVCGLGPDPWVAPDAGPVEIRA